MKKTFLILAVAALILFPTASFAQFNKAINKLDSAAGTTGLTKDLEGSVGNIISAVLSVVGTIFFGLTVYAGVRWMVARGNEEEVTKAQEIIKAAVIGLVVTLSAYAITAFVTGRLSGGDTLGSNVCAPGRCFNATDLQNALSNNLCKAVPEKTCQTAGQTCCEVGNE